MKYCEQTTRGHEINQRTNGACLSSINEVIEKDDSTKTNLIFERDVIVINLDEAEKVISRGQQCKPSKSMDICFGLTNKEFNLSILLVEFRFNYRNMRNLDKSELDGKLQGSKKLLGESISIKDEYIFIFQKDLQQQAKSRLQRMNPRVPSNYVVMNIYELKNKYFD
jgi:hypothetical protein